MFEEELKNIPPLNLPLETMRISKGKDGKIKYYDSFRKKWIPLSPEEFVRYQLLWFLIKERKFPSGLLSVEKEFSLFLTRKRYDAVFYNRRRKPLVLIECKAWNIKLKEEQAMQVWRYNLEIQAPHLLISNGVEHFFISEGKKKSRIPYAAELKWE